MAENEIIVVDEQTLRDKIYMIRGQQVMLDFDLAEIYGYEVRQFNQQVKRNIGRFPEDFMFQLTKDEIDLVKSQFVTSRKADFYSGQSGGRRKPPYAFTEQGVYMVATVLRGEMAEKQTIAIMRTFKAMRQFISQNSILLTQQDMVLLSGRQAMLEGEVREIKEKMVTKTDLPIFMELFDSSVEHKEILILDGEPFKADLAYQKIYRRAKRKIMVIDDYINTKTIQHLLHSKPAVKLTVISDNKGGAPLRNAEYVDFQKENPGRSINFIKTANKAHDRYIILDFNTKEMKVFHCGASSKDAGKKITSIMQVKDVSNYKDMVKDLLANPMLTLK